MTVLDEQLAYYRARAAEYDEWFFRQGRYDRGPDVNQRWHSEVESVRARLDAFRPAGDVLELACGTGNWTQPLARHADSVLAVDAAPEMLEINRKKLDAANVQYLQADLFNWAPSRPFDVVFFGFWLSHVPKDKFSAFWSNVRSALNPTGRVFFVDSLPNPDSQAKDHPIGKESSDRQKRLLNDGRRFEVIKRYYRPESLTEMLGDLGWDATLEVSGSFFLFGSVMPQ